MLFHPLASFVFDGALGTGDLIFYFGNLGVGSEAFEAALKEFEVDSDTFEVTFKAFKAAT